MTPVSYTTARKNFAGILQKVCEDHDPVIITRIKHDPVVMISLADFESMQETLYLLSRPANAKSLLEAVSELNALENE